MTLIKERLKRAVKVNNKYKYVGRQSIMVPT